MSGYQVEPAELFSAGALASAGADDARAELARLQAAAQDLLGHGWRGQAASAFAAEWHEWDEGARRMVSALEETARALNVTAREYESTEHGTTADLRRIA